jgi:hypothetical protein
MADAEPETLRRILTRALEASPAGASEDRRRPRARAPRSSGCAQRRASARAPGAVGADARHAPAPGRRPGLHRLTGGLGGEDVLAGRPVPRRLVHPPQLRSRADTPSRLTHEGGRRAEPVGPARPSAPVMPPATSVLSLIPLWRWTLHVPFGRPPRRGRHVPADEGGPVPACRPPDSPGTGPGPQLVSRGPYTESRRVASVWCGLKRVEVRAPGWRVVVGSRA